MQIRQYLKSDEQEWLKCRLLSFYDSSYFDNIVQSKDEYSLEDVNLVAVEENKIIGFIDIEIDKITNETSKELGAMIWDLGVLPEYRNKKIATQLFNQALEILKGKDIKRVQAWTQDDIPANKWYGNRGFKYNRRIFKCIWWS